MRFAPTSTGPRGWTPASLPDAIREKYEGSFELARAGIGYAQVVRDADAATAEFLPDYRPLHVEVRRKQASLRKLEKRLERLERDRSRLSRDETATDADRERVERAIEELQGEMAAIVTSIPATWEGARARYVELLNAQKKARRQYRQSVDEAYQTIADLRALVADADALRAFEPTLAGLDAVVANEPPEQAMEIIKAAERELGKVAGSGRVKGRLSKARRALRGNSPDPEKAASFLAEARERYAEEVAWRTRAAGDLLPGLAAYDDAIKHSIGLRVQDRLTTEQARLVAECKSVHRGRLAVLLSRTPRRAYSRQPWRGSGGPAAWTGAEPGGSAIDTSPGRYSRRSIGTSVPAST